MSLYLSFRSQSVGGAVVDPYVLEGDGTAPLVVLKLVDWSQVSALAAGKNVLFGVHGFNVSYEYGARSLGRLDATLGLSGSDVFLGVLWPGDYWLPVLNYPFEGDVAMDCGRRLAAFCQRWFAQAQGISFASHSLGARLVLEAVKNLGRPAQSMCLTAGAINQDALTTEYAGATAQTEAVSILASHEDWVLKLAFPVGDPLADVLHDDHTPFERALGCDGPPPPAASPIRPSWQIPDAAGYGHGDYLPPGDAGPSPSPAGTKWARVAGFMACAFRGQSQAWP